MNSFYVEAISEVHHLFSSELIQGLLDARVRLVRTGACLSQKSKNMDFHFNYISSAKRLTNEKIRSGRGPIDILIGIDHADIHTVETRQTGELVARQTPLVWVVFGGSSGNIHPANRILFVKYAMPVDLSDFWKTETMRVRIRIFFLMNKSL